MAASAECSKEEEEPHTSKIKLDVMYPGVKINDKHMIIFTAPFLTFSIYKEETGTESRWNVRLMLERICIDECLCSYESEEEARKDVDTARTIVRGLVEEQLEEHYNMTKSMILQEDHYKEELEGHPGIFVTKEQAALLRISRRFLWD